MTDIAADARFEFGRVVGRTFSLIGRNAVVFLILAICFVGIPQFGYAYFQSYVIQQQSQWMYWVGLGSGIVSLVTSLVLQGALTRASIDDLSGKGVRLGVSLGDGFRFAIPLFAMGLLYGLGLLIGLLLLVVPAIILAVRWSVAAPVVVVERDGPTAALGRSAELSEDHRWAIFGLGLLYFAAFYAANIGLTLALGSAGLSRGGASALLSSDPMALAAVACVVGLTVVFQLISTVGATALYFELRQVKEGVDVAELAKVFE